MSIYLRRAKDPSNQDDISEVVDSFEVYRELNMRFRPTIAADVMLHPNEAWTLARDFRSDEIRMVKCVHCKMSFITPFDGDRSNKSISARSAKIRLINANANFDWNIHSVSFAGMHFSYVAWQPVGCSRLYARESVPKLDSPELCKSKFGEFKKRLIVKDISSTAGYIIPDSVGWGWVVNKVNAPFVFYDPELKTEIPLWKGNLFREISNQPLKYLARKMRHAATSKC